jgi:hypothetical protein
VDLPTKKHAVAFYRAYVGNCFPGYAVAEADLNCIEVLLLQVATLRISSLQGRVQADTGVEEGFFETWYPHFL